MARIKAFEKPGIFIRYAYSQTKKILGKVPEPMTILAHHGKLFAGNVAFEMALMKSHKVDERLKALGGLKAATLAGCPF